MPKYESSEQILKDKEELKKVIKNTKVILSGIILFFRIWRQCPKPPKYWSWGAPAESY
jgi:hypothetical protein